MTARRVGSFSEQDPISGSVNETKRRNRLPYQRITLACSHCRRRKIRCIPHADVNETRCQNCIKLKKECIYQPVPGSGSSEPSQSRSSSRADVSENDLNHIPGNDRNLVGGSTESAISSEERTADHSMWSPSAIRLPSNVPRTGNSEEDNLTWLNIQQNHNRLLEQQHSGTGTDPMWPAMSTNPTGIPMPAHQYLQSPHSDHIMSASIPYPLQPSNEPHYSTIAMATMPQTFAPSHNPYALSTPADYTASFYNGPQQPDGTFYTYTPGGHVHQSPHYNTLYQSPTMSHSESLPGYLASQRNWPASDFHDRDTK